ESGWGRLTTNLDQFSDKMNNMGDTLTGFGQTMSMRVTAPIVATGGLALGAADKVEQAYRDIRVGTGATGEALDELEESFDNVFTSVPDGAEQVAGALANLNTFTGATGSVLEGLTKRVLDVSRLLKEDATQNAQTFGEALKQWQLPAEQGADVLDYMYKLTQDYGVGLGELNSQLTNYGSVLNNAGFEMDEAAHFMASLESNGIAVSRIMPGLNKAFRNWADEGKNSREELENIVETIVETEDKQKALSLATETFGAEGAQRLMTAIRNRAIPAFDELAEGAEGAKGSIETTAEETKTMGEEFAEIRNKAIRGLKPAGEILLTVARDHLPPLIEGVTNLAEWFDELDTSTQKTILSTAGFVAAIGPVSLVLGTTFKAISTVTGGMAALSGIIGRAGGAGLLGRIAGFGLGGPVGLAIGGLTALGAGIYAVKNRSEELSEVSYEKVRQMEDEINATDELITRFEELERQNKLTSDEMLEYMDVLDDLSSTSSPEKVEELTKKKEELEKQSGFTQDEMNEFLKLNDEIIEKSPSTAEAISEQGNAYADNLQALKELNREKREEMLMIAERDLMEALRNETQLLEDQARLEEEKSQALIDRQKAHDDYIEQLKIVNGIEQEQNDIQAEMQRLLELGYEEGDARIQQLIEEYGQLDDNRLQEQEKLDTLQEQLDTAKDIYNQKNDDLEQTREQLKEIDQLKYDYEALLLTQHDINFEKGRGLEAIDKEIQKLKDEKSELQELQGQNAGMTDEYQEQIEKIDEQIARLGRSRDTLKDMAYFADDLNNRLAQPINKPVNISAPDPGYRMLSYAEGTNHHPGGPAIVGEEGWELARYKNNWAALPLGIYDLPRGTQVFTHDESKQLMNALPAYADGVRPPSEFMKLLALIGKERHQPADSYGSSHSAGRESPTNITQHITIQSPEPVSPAEAARLQKKASRELAMELRW
ncbi:phage tail tape measure protein, partial [Piscibacillus sp. B03]|uniref:phage tail tape measure protein n=1 Tax=Piscibacillus sp. B03 TaxID=3457430 RepID=UPI003FCEADF5